MSQFDPPRPPNLPPEQDAFASEMMPAAPAPMSGMAVAGFVSSVIFCCPVLSPLLGLIFSLVGLAQTKGGARRGRGLAIAGLVIAIILIPLHGYGIMFGGAFVVDYSRLQLAMTELQNEDVNSTLSGLYQMGSVELKSSLGEDEFVEWIRTEFSAHGELQGLAPDMQQHLGPSPDGQSFQMNWIGEFVEETIEVSAVVLLDAWGHLRMENLIIGDANLRDAFGNEEDSPDDLSTSNTESGGEQ